MAWTEFRWAERYWEKQAQAQLDSMDIACPLRNWYLARLDVVEQNR